MASQKRGGGFNHYGRDQNAKKHQPQHRNPPPPELSSKDMQTGLVALLDRFVADETKCGADKEALHHANELRRLLCARDNTTSSHAKRELDEKRPDKAVKVAIPDYVDRKVRAAKDLPPLPPISEPHLHEAVFTHRSAIFDPSIPGSALGQDLSLDYERLELLGDAYIELIASRALYNRFPHVDVPELCMWRERLVENSTLGKFSHAYGFPDRLKHRAMWDKTSKQYQKVVADIVEAYVAAVVLSDPDNGFETAEAWLTELWAPQLLGFREKIIENPQARNELNRLVLGKDVKLITKEEKPMSYDENSIQCYYIGIYLTGWGYKDEWLGSGHGQNKVQAGVAAAADALKRDSPVLKDAIRQKNELRVARLKEQEEKAKTKEDADQQVIPAAEEPKDTNKTEQDIQVKKRKKEDDSSSC
ncbi:Double-strand-specific ribonuclease Pac1 [Pyrenophora tritici-repentis]|uniref:Rnc, dsRNA-specific ribonuclease n=1 Tax=Pyrenophora tritici-repentis TaxID=45151 RepID=A0A2W1DPX1_9PLEO|nr:Double-strand-specific ribonuclease Pac1 [Pyrenophora tritici-repentis]KAF7454267.1 Double-strand-specific ribonuclease Pac1 [Pyrenophora tritici-repentis]KAF7577366.1 Rnc, dsRNA-specific ribonuclease [Pyrenophora tritici-repentis]KAG9388014.1 Double-strand-specific ribonuclease Pac1 [Pyrenophora tritici-repentis]KAI0584831.1 Double-strand-specific ribonuclease Pac1 [Pyrenophora tritici-repentis]